MEKVTTIISSSLTCVIFLVFMPLVSTVEGKEPIPSENIYIYKKDAAFTEFIKHKKEYDKLDQFEIAAKISKRPEVSNFKDYAPYHLWAVFLVKHGMRIKDHLDKMTVELHGYSDTANSDTKPIEIMLTNTLKMHESKRNFEKDVEEYIHTFISTGIVGKSDQISSISLITNEINRSYDRLFNLATYKLNNISNSKTSETNIKLSSEAVSLSKVAIVTTIAIGIFSIIIGIIQILPLLKSKNMNNTQPKRGRLLRLLRVRHVTNKYFKRVRFIKLHSRPSK